MDTTIPSHSTWTDWLADNAQADQFTKLAALRKYIEQAARHANANHPGQVTAAWVNKKLPKLGVDAQIDAESSYVLTAPATGNVRVRIYAGSRTEALAKFASRTATTMLEITSASVTGDPTFTEGPEDPTPGVLPDDAPDTVDATLVKLRETILLAVVSGPKICAESANEVLDDFGLEHVPAIKTFTVSREATVTMRTNVSAFDEASAQRVAEWRWEDGRKNFSAVDAINPGDLRVATA